MLAFWGQKLYQEEFLSSSFVSLTLRVVSFVLSYQSRKVSEEGLWRAAALEPHSVLLELMREQKGCVQSVGWETLEAFSMDVEGVGKAWTGGSVLQGRLIAESFFPSSVKPAADFFLLWFTLQLGTFCSLHSVFESSSSCVYRLGGFNTMCSSRGLSLGPPVVKPRQFPVM